MSIGDRHHSGSLLDPKLWKAPNQMPVMLERAPSQMAGQSIAARLDHGPCERKVEKQLCSMPIPGARPLAPLIGFRSGLIVATNWAWTYETFQRRTGLIAGIIGPSGGHAETSTKSRARRHRGKVR